MKLIAAKDHDSIAASHNILNVANDADPRELSLAGVAGITLNFPKFTDGRAFSQAFLLRRRLGFKGEIRATGDVLVDQLPQMQRSGFDVAVLRADQSPELARRVLAAYPGHGVGKYQGDAVDTRPHFATATAIAAAIS
jgi:uncharacterized protein (DUF934 family)